MLVLHRRIKQEVLMHVPGRQEPIVVAVIALGGGWVKLGFAAPSDVRVVRGELEK